MARTLTIHDEELGATASVRVEHTAHGPLITAVNFAADPGRGISADAMRLIEALGLRLPDTTPTPAAVARKPRPVRKSPVRRPRRQDADALPATGDRPQLAAGETPAENAPQPAAPQPAAPQPAAEPVPAVVPQPRGARPSPQRLAELFIAHRGVMTAMAADLQVAPNTVAAWLRKARENGHRITLGADA